MKNSGSSIQFSCRFQQLNLLAVCFFFTKTSSLLEMFEKSPILETRTRGNIFELKMIVVERSRTAILPTRHVLLRVLAC